MEDNSITEFGSIIGGQEIKSGEWIDVFNPFTNKKDGKGNNQLNADIN